MTCYHIIKFRRSVDQTLLAYVGPQKLDTGLRSHGTGAWLTRRNTLLRHMCYTTKFGRFRLNRLGESRVRNFGDAEAPPLFR